MKESKNYKEYQIKLLLHKKYFDLGWGFTGYIKYLIALFGIASLDVTKTIILGLVYAVFCYIFGRLFIKYHWYEANIEISNIFNRFVRETREFIKNDKNKRFK